MLLAFSDDGTGHILRTLALVHPIPTASLLLPPRLSSLKTAHDSSPRWNGLSEPSSHPSCGQRHPAYAALPRQEFRLSLQHQTLTD